MLAPAPAAAWAPAEAATMRAGPLEVRALMTPRLVRTAVNARLRHESPSSQIREAENQAGSWDECWSG